MRKIKTALLILLLLIVGCRKSLIKISASADDNAYTMFGGIPSRSFYVPVDVPDSLILKWENSGHGSFANSSVTIYDQYVFTSDLSGRVFVYDIDDGSITGTLKYKGAVYTAPLVYKTLIVFGVAEQSYNLTELVFYDYYSGKVKVEKEIYSRILSEMIRLDDAVVFVTENGRINKYNLNGKLLWETNTDVTAHCSPALYKNRIIFGNDEGEIIAVDNEEGEIIYRKKFEGIFTGSAVIDDSVAYLSNNNGKVYAVRLNNGEKVWEFDTGSRVLMAPAFDDENIIVGNLHGDLFSLNKVIGTLKWKKQFKGLLNATPLLTKNRIILPDLFLSFYLIDKSNGEVVRKYKLDGRAKLTPVYSHGLLFIGFDNGQLRAYEFIE